MKTSANLWMLFLAAALFPTWTFGNEIYNRAKGFDIPVGSIAYMGSFFSPMKVHATDSDTQFLIPEQKVLFASPFFVADKPQAVNETNQVLQEKAAEMNLSLDSVAFNETYQNALLMHVLNPAKYLYNPQIGKFCGDRPFILIVIVDYYAQFPCSINTRENQDGQKINYWGKRSVIERDMSMFRIKGRQAAVALEYFLVSSKDGNTLWQGNTITTSNGLGTSYYGVSKGLIENALKNLMKQ